VNRTRLLKMACILFASCAASAIALSAQVLSTLHTFAGSPGDGSEPLAGLVQDNDGNFYGTTWQGGAHGDGVVFKITPSGTPVTLYSFCSQDNCVDGSEPVAGLVQATDGNLYGTTVSGGANGAGTVFRMTPSGALSPLYSFCSQNNCADGAAPSSTLLQATDGNFYGTTLYGGASNAGVVFKMTPNGTLSPLYSFCSQSNCADGANPHAGLWQGTDGNLYGTTLYGGNVNDSCETNTCGTVFKITLAGALSTLYKFCSEAGCADGSYPDAALVQATDDNFYGTTSGYGANGGGGTVFKMTSSGTLTALYSFCSLSGCADGNEPQAGLVQASDGDFYGTTFGGGANNSGTVFRITLSGALTTLYSFCSLSGCADGSYPGAGVVQARDRNLYGTTSFGGANSDGTVFRLVTLRACAVCSSVE
jgi:uncharacterized repeat protein (TIGR03803 family)